MMKRLMIIYFLLPIYANAGEGQKRGPDNQFSPVVFGITNTLERIQTGSNLFLLPDEIAQGELLSAEVGEGMLLRVPSSPRSASETELSRSLSVESLIRALETATEQEKNEEFDRLKKLLQLNGSMSSSVNE